MTRATGIGSWPGTDIRETLRMVRDLLGDEDGLPYLPELPARGPGADMVGRAAGLLVELPVDLQPAGWRLVDRPGRDAARTAALWRQDLDELAEAFDGWTGPLKVQVAGPWTLAASVELQRGERILADAGATRDLAASLTEGLRGHVADVERLVPGAQVVVQLDEPGLPAVLAGRLPTASGYGRVRPVDPQVVEGVLRDVVAALGERATVLHCCDREVPLPLVRRTGVAAISLDTTLLSPAGWESVAATVESGVSLYAGCLPTDGGRPTDDRPIPDRPGSEAGGKAAWQQVRDGWQRSGLGVSGLDDIVVSPACGLAGLTPAGARGVQRATVEVARALTEEARSG